MKKGVARYVPFVGGFGAKFGFPWLIAGLLLFVEPSTVLMLMLLIAFLCKVLTFGCIPLVCIVCRLIELCVWCCMFDMLPFFISIFCLEYVDSSVIYKINQVERLRSMR